jgi:hypothetical protein
MRRRAVRGLGPALAGLALMGCQEPQSFEDVKKYSIPIVDQENIILTGEQRNEYRVTVPGDVTHPSFEGRWTFRDPEKPIDIYVFPASRYTSGQPLAPEDSVVYWSSLSNAIGGLGQLRATEMHIHPRPGDWVIVYYNAQSAAAGPILTRAEFSTELVLTYFK